MSRFILEPQRASFAHTGGVKPPNLRRQFGRSRIAHGAVLRERSVLRFEDEPAHFARALDGVVS